MRDEVSSRTLPHRPRTMHAKCRQTHARVELARASNGYERCARSKRASSLANSHDLIERAFAQIQVSNQPSTCCRFGPQSKRRFGLRRTQNQTIKPRRMPSPSARTSSFCANESRKWVSRALKTLPGMMSTLFAIAFSTNAVPVRPRCFGTSTKP